MTTSCIQRNLIKLNRIINELDYYKKGIGRSNQRKRFKNGSYFKLVLEKANQVDGFPCFKCNGMIEPDSVCVAKYHNNNLIPIAIHYHTECFNSLYH